MLPQELTFYIDGLKKMQPTPSESAVSRVLRDAGWTDQDVERSLEYFRDALLPSAPVPQAVREEKKQPEESPASYVIPDWARPDFQMPGSERNVSKPPPVERPIIQSKPASNPPLETTSPVKAAAPLVAERPKTIKAEKPALPLPQKPVLPQESVVPKKVPPQPSNPSVPRQSPPKPEPKRKSYAGPLITIASVIFFGSIAGGAYAYYEGYWPFNKPPFAKETLLSEIAAHAGGLNAAAYTADIAAEVVAPSGGASAQSSFEKKIFEVLPPNFKALFSLRGNIDADDALEFKTRASGEVRLGDFLGVYDLEIVRHDSVSYFKLDKFPQLLIPGDFERLRGTWIKATGNEKLLEMDWLPTDLAFFSLFDGSSEREKVLKALLQAAASSNLFDVSDPLEETIDGIKTYKYALSVRSSSIGAFISAFEAELEKQGMLRFAKHTPQEIADRMRDFETLEKNVSIALWLTRKGELARMGIMYRLLGDPVFEAWSGKELRVTFGATLSDVGKQQEITAPLEFIHADQAALLLSGLSKEEYALQRQLDRIEEAQGALELYALIHDGDFPNSLEDVPIEIASKEKMFIDVYTDQPYAYSKLEKNYALRYYVELPPFDVSRVVPYLSAEQKKNTLAISLKYVEGLNTADAEILSTEARAEASVDTDKDLLSDSLELYIRTDPKKKDSDGDSISDYTEFTSVIDTGMIPR